MLHQFLKWNCLESLFLTGILFLRHCLNLLPDIQVICKRRHVRTLLFFQEQLIGVWKRFKNTIVFVTHDVDEAIYLADKIVIMDKNPGKIKEVFDVDMPRLRKRESEEFIKIQEEVLDKLNVEDF